ncbi:Membrane-bound lytic murein transglycosylase D precursor [Lunatimonas lonarensis]|uniref:Membrane-bound lytic murein transglycosylase D n=1 Tax=Lunatimonas lonarensis TaxID=1232681 RepID=R7ZYF1_9BACT|nr:lytic transglycosylase domain-containing protein [Lunatimonas lonarensis]EON79105.1 Membrane-bound lytic murein transglycosylase D precursor [Lunatimonas lonarensis]
MQNRQLVILYALVGILFLGLAFLWTRVSEFAALPLPETKEVAYLGPSQKPPEPRVRIFQLPERMDFAGEAVPLHQPDVYERLERELYVNAYWESNTVLMMKRAGRFFPVIERILADNGIPDDFKYVALIESGLMNVVSPAGARGFWQFMPSTAKEFGLEVNNDVDERYHWEKATVAACKYLRSAYGRFGSWTNVAASYNMGMAGVTRRINEQQVPNYYDLHLNDETSRYIFRVLAIKELFAHPSRYGFELQAPDLYQLPPYREVLVTSSIANLATWAIQHGSNYKLLKLHNPWLRSDKLGIRAGGSYKILLPL